MEPIDVSTFAALLALGYQLDCWCPGCRRWATCDLAMLVRNGFGDRRITVCKPRYRLCDSRGDWQVKPPVPQIGDSQSRR